MGLVDALDRARFMPLFLADGDGPLLGELERRGVTLLPGVIEQLSLRHPLKAWARTRRQVRFLREAGIDLLHVNEFGWNFDVVAAAALLGIPVVLHVHNPLTVDRTNLHRLVADRVVFVSEAQRRDTRHLQRLGRRTGVLHNAVDLAGIRRGRSVRGTLGIPPGRLVVGTVAQISRRKGTDVFVETARRVVAVRDDVQFIVVGRAGTREEEYANAVRAAAAEPALRGRVTFLGSRDDVPDLLASMDLFFLPTRAEPFGIVIIEAMAAGVPVVASALGGIPEIITSPALGTLVQPDDPDGSARALLMLLDDAPRRRQIAEAAQASLPGRFDGPAYAGRLHALYESLLEKRPRRP